LIIAGVTDGPQIGLVVLVDVDAANKTRMTAAAAVTYQIRILR